MEFREYKELVKQIPIGKRLPDAVYLHKSALDTIPTELASFLARAISHLDLDKKEWNLLKFLKRDFKVTLLNYPAFFDDAYPALEKCYSIDLVTGDVRESNYGKSDNPPILHRKETFLKPDHQSVPDFKLLTEEGERAGLYEKANTIGFKKSWERLISRKGFALDESGHLKGKTKNNDTLKPINPSAEIEIERHRTAINRDQLSAPMQLLARHNYFDGSYSVFDYGCGKGDDVRELEVHGIDVSAWDPVHRSDGNKRLADIVNLGYVINVIEDRKERDEALRDAYSHAKKVLAVSAMVAGEATTSQFAPYKDGVITSRNTFQKYYSQSELRSYLETNLSEHAIAAGQGIFFIFKDKDEEQLFLSERQRVRRDWIQISQRERRPTISVPVKDLVERNQELFDDFWQTCLNLGRIPANPEFEFSDRLRQVAGSHRKAYEALIDVYDDEDFIQAQKTRKDDLLVYFALGLFRQRKPYTHMPDGLRRDLKAFFTNYSTALDQAKELLFSVGDPVNIKKACIKAYDTLGCGVIEEGHSYTLLRELIGELPPSLRVYIGCATQLYGDINDIDLVKIHMTSGKVTLMKYDDFSNKPLPLLLQRTKIKLRDQDIDFFDYTGEYEPQPLYRKSLFLSKTDPTYDRQYNFENELAALPSIDLSGFGPSYSEFISLLKKLDIKINGYELSH